MKSWWADTLFKRLFLLMWAALVGSHLLAFAVVHSLDPPHGLADRDGPGPRGRPLPTLGSLPPGGPMPSQPPGGPMPSQPPRGLGPPREGGPPPPGEAPAGAPGMPSTALWLDYAIRFVVMGIAAWFGARWLTQPVRRLGAASRTLAPAIARREPLPVLDGHSGTLEVRQAAQVFNAMARQLHAQFDAQSLLMAAISHDLRTPLARLRLRLEALPAPAERCIVDVEQMDTLIGGVLDMIRDRHAGAPAERLDLASLLQALVDDLAEQGHAVRFDSAVGGPMLVLARPAALTRVFGNLLGNALRHGGSAAGVAIGIEGDAAQWRVHVDDRGPGIPADRLAAVFQPFYRVDVGRRRNATADAAAPGMGLGLYIARDLAERERGSVMLTPRPGGGLRATVALPRAA